MNIDLHTHSNCSDGDLPPTELVSRAVLHQVDMLALTDHDTTAGLQLASECAAEAGIRFIPGVEYSCQWQSRTIHVLGLNIALDEVTAEAMSAMQAARRARGQRIQEKLAAKGFPGIWDGAKELSGLSEPGRPHMARFMVRQGWMKNEAEAFRRYLGRGKIGDVKTHWPSLAQVVQWIRNSGGVAVLAHPAKYGLTRTKLINLLQDFSTEGGQAAEVWGCNQSQEESRLLLGLCRELKLHGSVGSDFHRVAPYSLDVGKVTVPENDLPKVWELF